ncbi:haloacid dehalogenase, type II [Teratosphaeria destructans]|uniref:Haloacid dehalogenase, type II n=1 Tax=Teratosphaeria destructans TaxID=418781 RepID=A0A9W7W3R5_9PEZI|nr:haloacid dehalogenase, type II [Teratosphaeria destructans]
MGNDNPRIVLAFDAYGTLLSTQSIAQKLTAHFGEEKAKTIAAAWRKYQLEYTWRLNSMGHYEDFSAVTRRSLRHALAESSVKLDEKSTEEMMRAYDSLTCFPDVERTMNGLKSTPDIKAVVFSNGTHQMVSTSVKSSPDLSKHANIFQDIVVVEEVKKFKPAKETYMHLAHKVGKDPNDKKQLEQIWLVSGNPFDVVGARAAGLNSIWVDREGNGWQDSLVEGEKGRPTEIVKDLDKALTTVMSFESDELTTNWREMHGDVSRGEEVAPKD